MSEGEILPKSLEGVKYMPVIKNSDMGSFLSKDRPIRLLNAISKAFEVLINKNFVDQ